MLNCVLFCLVVRYWCATLYHLQELTINLFHTNVGILFFHHCFTLTRLESLGALTQGDRSATVGAKNMSITDFNFDTKYGKKVSCRAFKYDLIHFVECHVTL